MDPTPEAIGPTLSVQDFVMEHTLRHGQRALPVVENGQLAGIVSITDAKQLNHDAWATTPVSAVMTRPPLKTLPPDADLSAALELMVTNGIHQVPIESNGVLVGMLKRSDVMRHLQLRRELDLRGSASPSGSVQARRVPSTATRPPGSRGS